MNGRAAHLVKGLGALAVLIALVAGVPWALWHFVGWPLPHHVPTAGEVGRALSHQGIPAQVLVDALAVVVWLTWASLLASLAAEIPAALAGCHASRIPVAGVLQPLTGRLVAAVVVACLTLAPRPAHATPQLSVRPVGLLAHRAVPALVVRDAAFSARLSPSRWSAAPVVADAALTGSAPEPVSPAPAVAQRVYVVQRGDTLWGIAERELGDPLRWSEIYALNEGRPQPGGAVLDDPHWIDPGWILLLPAPSAATAPTGQAPASSPPAVPTAPVPPAASTPTTTPPTTPPASTIPPTGTTPPMSTTPRGDGTPKTATADGHRGESRHGEPVRLPSGSVVAASFAAGVAATVAIGQLRRRHAYRYRPPAPGRTRVTEPLRPTVAHLRRAAAGDEPVPTMGGPFPPMPVDDDQRRQDPGRLDVGTRDGEILTVELGDLSGVALDGPAVDEVARALVAALVVRAGPGAAEVLCDEGTAERLFPGLPSSRSIRRAASADLVARAVESERVARTRLLGAVDVDDAEQFRSENPEHPLPLLLVLLDDVPAGSLGRWAALVADASRLAIAVVFLSPAPVATGTLRVDSGRRVLDTEPSERLGSLVGSELFGLRADEAAEVLGATSEATEVSDVDDYRAAVGRVLDTLRTEPWPEPSPSGTETTSEATDRPVTVRMFGHLEVTVCGEPVVTGLRSRARDLFTWFLLRPEGATSDEAVDALWPDTEPGRVHGQFWRSFSDLRARLREAGGEDLEVLTKAGEHYRPNQAEIACDLWEFQRCLEEASRTADPETARAALRRAVGAYRGELLAGLDRPWVEPVRQDLHRRALDAHLRLAELEDQAGRSDAAAETLERAIALDRYAEEPYRRLMALHGAEGRLDAVREVWRLLQGRLAELDLDVEPATASLYRQLTAPQPASPQPVRSR